MLADFLDGQVRPEEAIVRFEPALDRAIALARGFQLLAWEGRYWKLSERGLRTLSQIDADEQTLQAEKSALASLPRQLSQAAVERLLRRKVQ